MTTNGREKLLLIYDTLYEFYSYIKPQNENQFKVLMNKYKECEQIKPLPEWDMFSFVHYSEYSNILNNTNKLFEIENNHIKELYFSADNTIYPTTDITYEEQNKMLPEINILNRNISSDNSLYDLINKYNELILSH